MYSGGSLKTRNLQVTRNSSFTKPVGVLHTVVVVVLLETDYLCEERSSQQCVIPNKTPII
jgi:hypothetical protein